MTVSLFSQFMNAVVRLGSLLGWGFITFLVLPLAYRYTTDQALVFQLEKHAAAALMVYENGILR